MSVEYESILNETLSLIVRVDQRVDQRERNGVKIKLWIDW